MAAVRGGKLKKDQTFHHHRSVRSLHTEDAGKKKRTFAAVHRKRKHKKSVLHRSAIRREVRRLLQADDGVTNSSAGALLQSAAAGREAFLAGRSVIRTAKRTRNTVKTIRNFKAENPGKKLVEISLRNRRFQVLGKPCVKRLLRSGAGTGLDLVRGLGSNSKEALVQMLDTRGTANTSAGSIHMTVRSAEVAADAVRSGKKVYKIVKRVRDFRQKARAGKKAAKTAAAQYKGTKKTAQAAGAVIKKILAKQPVLVLGMLAGMILIGLLTSVTSSGTMSMLVTNTILMDAETAMKYQEEMNALEANFQQRINGYKSQSGYDDIRIDYMCESGELKPNWPELLAVMAVEFEQDLSFSPQEQQRIRELFELMNEIKTRTEKFRCGGCCTCGENPLHCHGEHVRLIVEVYAYGMDDIELELDEDDMEWARNLATSDMSELFPELCPPAASIPPADLSDLIASAPVSSATREEIRDTALSLVGRVKYFWGGKSAAGWNPQWGKSKKVTALGSSSTGTYQPYGLDCSGFVDWVYKTAGVGNVLSGGSSYQWNASYAIAKSDLQVGDLVFKQPPGRGTNHVGIFVGRDSTGRELYCHCAWSQGVTVDSYKGFKYYRRPLVQFD